MVTRFKQEPTATVKFEEIEIFRVYKKDGNLNASISRDAMDFELYGFLKLFIEDYGEYLTESIQDTGEDERY